MTKPGTDVPPAWFADLPRTASGHFTLCFYGTVLGLLKQAAAACGSLDQALAQFPFLAGYHRELAGRLDGWEAQDAFRHWWTALADWEQTAEGHLPWRALADATGLARTEYCVLLTLGLVEEDSRFGHLLEALQGLPGIRRPTLGFLRSCWHETVAPERIAALVHQWQGLGLVQAAAADAPRVDQPLQIPPALWDALRATPEASVPDWARVVPNAELPTLDELVLPSSLAPTVAAIPRLLREGPARVVVIRGPHHNGRRTTLAAIAHDLGRELVEVRGLERPDDPRWPQAALLSLLRHALPIVAFEPAPGETVRLPDGWPDTVPLGVVLGPAGPLEGRLAADALHVTLPLPSLELRGEQWRRTLGPENTGVVADAAERFRLTTGHIARAARLARSQAALAGRQRVDLPDLVAATRSLNRRALDALARRVPVQSDLSQLCVSDETAAELRHLEQRCRHRDRLPALLEGSPGGFTSTGVRSLFTGPSGTGKTLAARLLAGTLGKDLYQLDLAAVVNKYIGETEKNLSRIFDLAEELDVILLLDEGDALLTRRTDVQSANDRYANLETNFLLQRLETFDGIVIVTTNARGRLDPAFERRLDIVVEFHLPDAHERWQLWNLHLPPGRRIDEELLTEVAGRCEFTGGQIRNAVVHASLLALDNGGVVTSEYLEAAVRREYRKQGELCPLPGPSLGP